MKKHNWVDIKDIDKTSRTIVGRINVNVENSIEIRKKICKNCGWSKIIWDEESAAYGETTFHSQYTASMLISPDSKHHYKHIPTVSGSKFISPTTSCPPTDAELKDCLVWEKSD